MPEFEFLWENGPKLCMPDGSFKVSTDSVLLFSFVSGKNPKKAVDLGCGGGILPVLMSHKFTNARICGIEIQEEQASLARGNLEANSFDASGIVTGDLRQHRGIFAAGEFDLVLSNPPYFPVGSGAEAPLDSRGAARDERFCTIEDICNAAKYLLKWGGCFAVVHRPERLSELFCAMTKNGIEPKRLRMVQYSAGAAPSLVLAEGKRGAKPSLVIEKPLILTEADGTDSEEIKRIYHRL